VLFLALISCSPPSVPAWQSASTVYCHIAFGELVSNFPEKNVSESITTIVPALIDVLDDIPYIDFDRNLSWEGAAFTLIFRSPHNNLVFLEWALPDQLVYSTVSALLRISSLHSDHVSSVVGAIGSFIEASIENIKNGSSIFDLRNIMVF
jgi:phosphatidylinositol 4-kinase A